MKQTRSNIYGAILIVMLALATIIVAPFASLGYGATDSGTFSAMPAKDGCHSDASDTKEDGCDTSACACACHAPLASGADLPLPVMVTIRFAALTTPVFPQVDLPIFVPPQNRS